MKVFVDMDGTCFYRKGARPHLRESIDEMKKAGCEVIFWTGGNISHYKELLDGIFPEGVTVIEKEAGKLPDEKHIIIDDFTLVAPKNRHSVIVEVAPYCGEDADCGLPIAARTVGMIAKEN